MTPQSGDWHTHLIVSSSLQLLGSSFYVNFSILHVGLDAICRKTRRHHGQLGANSKLPWTCAACKDWLLQTGKQTSNMYLYEIWAASADLTRVHCCRLGWLDMTWRDTHLCVYCPIADSTCQSADQAKTPREGLQTSGLYRGADLGKGPSEVLQH